MDVAQSGRGIGRGELVVKELDRLIERRSRQKDPEEEHDLWRASERAYFARRNEQRCLERLTYHEGQAARLGGVLVSSWLTTRPRPRSTETD